MPEKKEKEVLGWHFLPKNKKLRYGDNRIVRKGRSYKYTDDAPPKMCYRGMHASEDILDALQYAPGPIVCRVALSGDLVLGFDKNVARVRRVIDMIDAEELPRKFARMCALDVVHLWNAPEAVVKYLKTGDESLRAAARDAAWGAAAAAARKKQSRRLERMVRKAMREKK